jgi:acetyl-CoA carboxylase carboxyltransferase component
MGDVMKKEVKKLSELRKEIKKMGGEEAVKKHHDRGKLTARERLDLLIEKDTFVEVGMLGSLSRLMESLPAMAR